MLLSSSWCGLPDGESLELESASAFVEGFVADITNDDGVIVMSPSDSVIPPSSGLLVVSVELSEDAANTVFDTPGGQFCLENVFVLDTLSQQVETKVENHLKKKTLEKKNRRASFGK